MLRRPFPIILKPSQSIERFLYIQKRSSLRLSRQNDEGIIFISSLEHVFVHWADRFVSKLVVKPLQ